MFYDIHNRYDYFYYMMRQKYFYSASHYETTDLQVFMPPSLQSAILNIEFQNPGASYLI